MCAVRFDAAADRLLRTTDLLNVNSNYTVMFWFYLVSDLNATGFFFSVNDNAGNNLDAIGLNADGVTLVLGVAVAGAATNPTGSALTVGAWNHIAITRTSTTDCRVYLNGVQDIQDTRNVGSRTQPNSRMEIGAIFSSNLFRADCRVAYIKAWTVGMDAGEILREMQAVRPVNAVSLYGYWPTWPTERTTDYSGNGRDWTQSGTLTDEQEPPVSFGHGVYLLPFAAAAGPTEIEDDDTQALEDDADAVTLIALSGVSDTQALEDGADSVTTLLADTAATDSQALEDDADSITLIALSTSDTQAIEDAADTASVFMAEALFDDDTLFVNLFADDIVSLTAALSVTDTQALEDAADTAAIAAETTATDTQAIADAADSVTLISLSTTDTQALEDGADAVALIGPSTTDTQDVTGTEAIVGIALSTTDTQALEDAADTAVLDTGDVALPIVEPFTGTNGDPWNTTRWTTGAGGTGVVDIQSNQGRMLAQGGAFAYTRALSNMAPIDNIQVEGSFQVDTLDEQYWAVNLRQSAGWDAGIPANPQTGYWFEFAIAGNQITVHRGVAGTRTDISSVGFTWDDDTLYHFKAQVSGTRVRIRVWEDGDPEPNTWNLSITDANVTDPGVASVSGSNGAAATAQTILWENITISEAPTLIAGTDSQAVEDAADAISTLLADLIAADTQALTAAADTVTLIALSTSDTQALEDGADAATYASSLTTSDTQGVTGTDLVTLIAFTRTDTQALAAQELSATQEVDQASPQRAHSLQWVRDRAGLVRTDSDASLELTGVRAKLEIVP